MSNVIVTLHGDHTEIIDAEIIDIAPKKPGVILRSFIAMGSFVEATLACIQQAAARSRREVGSFVRAIPGWISDLSFRLRWHPVTLKTERGLRRSGSWLIRQGRSLWPAMCWTFHQLVRLVEWLVSHPTYIARGTANAWRSARPRLLDVEGREDAAEIRDKKHSYHRVAKKLDDEELWEKHTKAVKLRRSLARAHMRTVAMNFLVTAVTLLVGLAILGVLWLFVTPWLVIGVVSLVTTGAVVGAWHSGKRYAMLVDEGCLAEDDNRATITNEYAENVFQYLGVPALRNAPVKLVRPGIRPAKNGNGIEFVARLPRGVKASAIVQCREAFASAWGDIDTEQVIMRKVKADRIEVRISDTLPSERQPTGSPYARMSSIDTLARIHFGTDALGAPMTYRSGFATIIVASPGIGKSELLYSYASQPLLHPRGILFMATFKKVSNLGPLLSLANRAVVGDEDRDRDALASFVRLVNEFKEIGVQRRALMDERDDIHGEVTDEIMLHDPDFPPAVLIVDEADYPIQAHPDMRQIIMNVNHSIRSTGMKIVLAVQQVTKSGVNQELAQSFPWRVVSKVGSTHELTALAGDGVISSGFDTKEYDVDADKGRFVLVGDGGLRECWAHHWTDADKAALAMNSRAIRQVTPLNVIPVEAMPQEDDKTADEDLASRILAIRDAGTFGDKGVWAQEYPALCELLGITAKDLKDELKRINVNPSHGFWKYSQSEAADFNRRGFLFEHINQAKEQ